MPRSIQDILDHADDWLSVSRSTNPVKQSSALSRSINSAGPC
jgi:hypothetical protein